MKPTSEASLKKKPRPPRFGQRGPLWRPKDAHRVNTTCNSLLIKMGHCSPQGCKAAEELMLQPPPPRQPWRNPTRQVICSLFQAIHGGTPIVVIRYSYSAEQHCAALLHFLRKLVQPMLTNHSTMRAAPTRGPMVTNRRTPASSACLGASTIARTLPSSAVAFNLPLEPPSLRKWILWPCKILNRTISTAFHRHPRARLCPLHGRSC